MHILFRKHNLVLQQCIILINQIPVKFGQSKPHLNTKELKII